MSDRNHHKHKAKLSPAFKSRLNSLEPTQKVKAVVVLETRNAASASEGRQSRTERKAALEAVRKSASAALPQIDKTLGLFDGQRLSAPDVLGAIVVESNAAGIMALTESKYVKAILEDQPISTLKGKRRFHPEFPN